MKTIAEQLVLDMVKDRVYVSARVVQANENPLDLILDYMKLKGE